MPSDNSYLIRSASKLLVEQLGPWIRREEILTFDEALTRVTAAQNTCLSMLSDTGLWGRENQLPSGDFWKTAGWVVGAGPLQLRARDKPLGYAGDYLMLNQITEDRIADDEIEGPLDRYFQNHSAPRAVRNRTVAIAEQIVALVRQSSGRQRAGRNNTDCPLKVVSVGAGSAPEVRLALSMLEPEEVSRLQVVLLDLDPYALEFATSQLALPATQLMTHRVNLYRLPRVASLTELIATSDMIFCAGLFDYLNHKDAVAMFEMFWKQLNTNGRLLVFNFAQRNPSRAYMEWFGNWYLEYRTIDLMQQLAVDAGVPGEQFEVKVEAENVNLYLEAVR